MRLASGALFVIASSPALAAGDGFEGMPTWTFAIMSSVVGITFGLPVVAIGFAVQGFLRLRNAAALLFATFLVLLGWCLATRGSARTLELAPSFTAMLLVLGSLAGLGWYIGTRDANRSRLTARVVRKTELDHG